MHASEVRRSPESDDLRSAISVAKALPFPIPTNSRNAGSGKAVTGLRYRLHAPAPLVGAGRGGGLDPRQRIETTRLR